MGPVELTLTLKKKRFHFPFLRWFNTSCLCCVSQLCVPDEFVCCERIRQKQGKYAERYWAERVCSAMLNVSQRRALCNSTLKPTAQKIQEILKQVFL